MLRTLALSLLLFVGFTHAAPAPVLQRPIDLDTGSGVLRGSLLLPKRDGRVPVALLIAGSGPTDRDGNNPYGGRNDGLKRLARLLAGHGIASVRFDKRGVAASKPAAPDERSLSVEGYVADAIAWGRRLKDDPRFGPLILIGHSEGALIASLAAEPAGADALVVIAGTSRPVDDLLREQLGGRLPPPLLAESEALIESLKAGHTVDEVPDELQVLFRPSVQPYLISLFRQQPAEAFGRLRLPALIIQGTHDIQVSVKDAERLKAARPDAELALIPGMNHVMRVVPLDRRRQLDSYDEPGLPLAGELGPQLFRFIDALPASSAADGSR
ncbi:alpha/beta hydrolase [Pseudomonas mangiferae]|uniref:Lysophospholipase n=1 Tax=Pseudomonas mangiferae TaxID=2593654 RepID=A0A553H2H1_9PSED|nr:alpha/beta fold hydrolase [Pseudomonas mangiferae]TRX75943.1 lysophospholipase [Pseudomonas mangiferae]